MQTTTVSTTNKHTQTQYKQTSHIKPTQINTQTHQQKQLS